MKPKGPRNREFRNRISLSLASEDFSRIMAVLEEVPVRKAIRVLLAALVNDDQRIRMRSAMALGVQVSRLAEQDMVAAREVMRRLMWSLNHESGSAGWGSVQGMAEIMLNHEGLAEEYAHMLVSYMQGEANLLEEVHLQLDLLQGLGRLGQARPEMLRDKGACAHLAGYMKSETPPVRGLAAWCAGLLGAQEARPELEGLLKDTEEITFYRENEWVTCRVGHLAEEALYALPCGTDP